MTVKWRVRLMLIGFTFVTFVCAGCRGAAAVKTTSAPSSRSAEDDSLAQARDTFKKASGVVSFRQGILQLNAYMSHAADRRPPALSDAQRDFFTNEVGLDAEELAEVNNPTYTPLDAHYLDLCFLLRDAARVCTAGDQTPLRRAEAAFAWVVRQIRLPVPERERGNEAEPLPPQFVLRRGWGTPVERAFVFLALLQQLGIDGCMVTLPGESDIAKYWLPGALIDKEIYLFDTRMGIPLPATDGKGIATLSQLRTVDTPFAALHIDDTNRYDVTAEQVKQAALHLSYPVSAFAPRMKKLETLLEANKVRLGVDLSAGRQRFTDAATSPGLTLHVNNRPTALTSHSPIRVMRRFLPLSEGGTNTAKDMRKDREEAEMFPWSALKVELPDRNTGKTLAIELRESPYAVTVLVRRMLHAFATLFVQFPLPAIRTDSDTSASRPDDLFRSKGQRESTGPERDDVIQRFVLTLLMPDKAITSQTFAHFALAPRSSRDDVLRGRFDDAVVKLTNTLEQVNAQKGLARRTDDIDARMRHWLDDAMRAQAQLRSAQEKNNKAEMELADRRLGELWLGDSSEMLGSGGTQVPPIVNGQRLPIWLLWMLGHAAEPMGAEASYLLALSKHEQAERAQASTNRNSEEKIKDAWRTADGYWSLFLEEHPASPAATAARICRARTLEALGDREGSVHQLRTSSQKVTPLERLGLLYRAGVAGRK